MMLRQPSYLYETVPIPAGDTPADEERLLSLVHCLFYL